MMLKQKKLAIDYVHVERSEIEETGEYDLEGLFIRLGQAIDSIGAKRVVLDTIESLFAGLSNQAILRAELRRLFRWLKDKGVTAVITAERGDGSLTRHGLEEYVSDCVILLDHRVTEQISTRRLRVVKYRGSVHGTNEYPFLIDENGISVLPVTSLGLAHEASFRAAVSSGIPGWMPCSAAGLLPREQRPDLRHGRHGQDSLAAHFVDAACRRGERCLYFALRGIAQPVHPQHALHRHRPGCWIERAAAVSSGRGPRCYGLEMHLATMHRMVHEFKPQAVVIDPISNLISVGTTTEVKSMLMRMVDFLKSQQITAVFTSLTAAATPMRTEPRWASRRSWTPGSCCATSNWAASATGACTS